MNEIKQIKEALEEVGTLPWKYLELRRGLDYDAIKDANGKTIIGISSYTQENIDFLLLAVNNISSLITTIESLQEKISNLEKDYREVKDELNIVVATENSLIESQKEEIESITRERDFARRKAEEAWREDDAKDTLIESLKAITDIAVKALEQMQFCSGVHLCQSIAGETLDKIKAAQNDLVE